MVRVKVCGIRSLKEGLWAAEAGADALGFVLHPQSRRYIEPSQVKEITTKLPPFLARVGVFVDKPRDTVEAWVEECRLTVVQLHGAEKASDWRGSPYPIIKALKSPQPAPGLSPSAQGLGIQHLEELSQWKGIAQAILIDSVVAGKFGGTGEVLPWAEESLQKWIKAVKQQGFSLILAGGLTPQNVREGIRLTEPYAVDVSTGVEKDGQKEPTLMQEFFRKALTIS